MLNYTFKAKNSEGALVSGSIQADRRETVITALKQKGYFLLSVQPKSRLWAGFDRQVGIRSRVSTSDKAIFTQQLATLLKAGMQLSMALKTLSKQTENKYLGSVIEQLQRGIEQSSSLSEAMTKHEKVFSKVYRAIVQAAEQSGSLVETLYILSRQLKAKSSVTRRIRAALVYPIFLLAVSILVVAVLTTFVIPKFIRLFVNTEQSLPLATKILVVLTNSVKDYWWLVLLGLSGLACIVLASLKNARARYILDGWLLRLPLIGSLNKKLQLARFSRTLGSLLNGGVRIISAIKITQGTTSNRAFAEEIGKIELELLKGAALTKAVSRQNYFSELTANMVAVGEDTGMLPEMLMEVANMYDQESESSIDSMTKLLGPAMIVVLGLIIGFVVLAILLPIFETSTILR